jgi:glucose/mannose-6-phosphate isomerase
LYHREKGTDNKKGGAMLDDMNVLKQRDSERTLDSTGHQYEQLTMELAVAEPEHDSRPIKNIVFAGMGGSGLAPEFVQAWLDVALPVPLEVVKSYQLPAYADESTLVIAGSCSGNTEEILSAYQQARQRNCQIAIITGGGDLLATALRDCIVHVALPRIEIQPRMQTFVQVRALVVLLDHFGVLKARPHLEAMASAADWLRDTTNNWTKDTPMEHNYAKQLALMAVGKTPVIYGGYATRSLAYKWKISFNENAKNVAFWNYYPEFNHNEFIGWTSHPVDKPFVIFDLASDLEHSQIQKRFEISDRLLSGMRPKANTVYLEGDSLLEKLLSGHVLADFVSIYVGILNNVDPGPVKLITKLKQEL